MSTEVARARPWHPCVVQHDGVSAYSCAGYVAPSGSHFIVLNASPLETQVPRLRGWFVLAFNVYKSLGDVRLLGTIRNSVSNGSSSEITYHMLILVLLIRGFTIPAREYLRTKRIPCWNHSGTIRRPFLRADACSIVQMRSSSG